MNNEVRTVPPVPSEFAASKFRWNWHERVARGVRRGHTLVISDHGMGKTYTGRIIAGDTGLPMWYVSASYGLERSVLEGQYFPDTDQHGIRLVATDGIVSSAVLADGLLVIDEFFRLPGEVQSCLFAAMDAHRGDYTIAYRGATIRVGEHFRVLGFTNPPSPMYPEVEIADRALLSRFSTVINVPFPDGKEWARFMAHLKFPKEHLIRTINFLLRVRLAFQKGDIDNFVSPRDVVFFNDAITAGLSIDDAFADSIVGKFGARFEEAIRGFWVLNAGKVNPELENVDPQ